MNSSTLNPSANAKAVTKATARFAKPSANFSEKLASTEALLREAAQTLQPLTQASSLGAEDVLITHIIHRMGLVIPIFVLETGALHTETLALLERTQASALDHPQAPVTVYRPATESVIEFVRNQGQQSIYASQANRKACCHIRKMEPLSRALNGQRAWVTGLRKEQSNARAEVPLREVEKTQSTDFGGERTKLNPLADWTWGDVWHYIATQGVDYNPLHDQFFPSIGCAPCTRAISLGEDFRAGRWWWEDDSAKECGLHVKALS